MSSVEMIRLLIIKSYEEKNKIIANELKKIWNMVNQEKPKEEIIKIIDSLEEFIIPRDIVV